MGQSLNNIKRRINTINSTRKITRSMKLVSNVKCRRFMVEEYKQREYSSLLRKIILDCIKLKKDLPNDELPPLIREKKKTNKRFFYSLSSFCLPSLYISLYKTTLKNTNTPSPMGS